MLILIAAMVAGALSCGLFAAEIQDALEHSRNRARALARLRETKVKGAAGLQQEEPHPLLRTLEKVREGVNPVLYNLPKHPQLPPVTSFLNNTKEIDLLREQIPPALDSLSVAVGSGLSLVQAFERVADEAKEPLGSLFAMIPQGIQAGLSMKEALAKLQEEFPEDQMETLFVTLELHYRTGGNLAVLLERTAIMQRENNELRRELGVKTAQARFSAKVVGVLPLGLLAALTLFSSDYIAAFFSSITGFVILMLALSMEFAGYVLVKRASEVDLS